MSTYGFGRGALPQIPKALMHDMYKIESGVAFSQEQGGQWIPTEEKRIRFQGVVLPVTDKDLMRDMSGTITRNTIKIYTNGFVLEVGARVEDREGVRYTITQELDHNTLHPMKRYLAEKSGKAASR